MSDLFILRRRGTFLLIVLEMSGPVLPKRCRCVSSFLQASGACEAAESTWEMVGASLSIITCVQTARVCARDAWSECCWRWTRCSFSDMAYEHDSARVRAALWIPPRESIPSGRGLRWIALLRLWHIYGGMQVSTEPERCWRKQSKSPVMDILFPWYLLSRKVVGPRGHVSCPSRFHCGPTLFILPERTNDLRAWRPPDVKRKFVDTSAKGFAMSPKCSSHTLPPDYVIRHTEGCDASVASHWQQHQACPGDLVNRQWCWQSCLS
jgi:hypothetical protein